MRKLVIICMALAVLAGCSKEEMVTGPCGFDIRIDWVRGSRLQFSVTPDNPQAWYTYGVMQEGDFARFSDSEIIDIQLDWMNSRYNAESYEQEPVSSFAEMFCYKGERTFRVTQLSPGISWRLLVFQMNPQTRDVIGPLYIVPFETLPVPKEDMSFSIVCNGGKFTIIPSDKERTWFWEYESEDKLRDVYGSPYFFYYSIIDMYDQYDFLDNLLCKGEQEWILPQDDRSIKEDTTYTMAISGCAGGEITSDVYYADFVYSQGTVRFDYADFPVEYSGRQ